MQRRSFMLSACAGPLLAQERRPSGRPRVAAILNSYFPNSHADVFMGRLLSCYRLNGTTYHPRVDVVSMYVDQFPINDMAKEQAEEYKVRMFPSIAEALRMGGKQLAVDGVAIIGEHGTYARTPRGNFMYPRWKHF